MKINRLKVNIICKEILDKIKIRNTVLSELRILDDLVEKKKKMLRELDLDFRNLTIDVKKYRLFFKTYDIWFHNANSSRKGSIYHVKKIKLVTYNKETFYDVIYDFIDLDNPNNNTNGTLSLRKYMHLLDEGYAKLRLIEK